mmetsp:Transcript_3609/g.5120  ORF Transcript_3609/g.5120 Transcript_3609/m.5120 type:complete len:353 (+) Transcript_3609:1-1059(+)
MQKIEEGKLELDIQPFNFADAVSGVVLIFGAAAASKGQHLQQEMVGSIPCKVMGDRFRVEHVLGNLLSNAIKFSPQGGRITISITSSNLPSYQDEEWANITVGVRDEGPGIALEHQHNFVQLDAGQLQKGQGSGLVLSLCKQIVELHDGTIGMRSQPGQGSEFHFSIPFQVLLPSSHSRSSHRPSNNALLAETVAVPNKKERTVLVVDDVEMNRKMLKMLLGKEGVASEMAENGQIALDMVLSDVDKYSILLMDNHMPVMNGVEASKRLRIGGYKNLIVGVTGNVLEDDVSEFLAAGADLVMFKPLKMAQLSTLLTFMDENGSTSMWPFKVLKQVSNTLEWVDENSDDLEWR